MKKLISLISAMGLGLSGAQGAMAVQSCGSGAKGWTETAYKDYFSVNTSEGTTGITSFTSSSDGNNAVWSIHSSNELQQLTMVKKGAVKVSFATKDSNVDTKEHGINAFKNTVSEDDADSITNEEKPTSIDKDDKIILSNNDIGYGNLNIQFYASATDSKPEFTLVVKISNDCYQNFLVAGWKNTDGVDNDIVASFDKGFSTSGSASSSDSFTVGKDYAYIVVDKSVDNFSVDFGDTKPENVQGLRIANTANDAIDSKSIPKDDTIVRAAETDESGHVTINTINVTNLDKYSGNDVYVNYKIIYIGYTDEQKNDEKNPNISAKITLHSSKNDTKYDLNVNFTGEIIVNSGN